MIIRNKFNGFAYDGSRRCYDPATLAITAAGAGELGTAAAAATAAGAAGTTAAGLGAGLGALGTGAAGVGALGSLEAGLAAGSLMAGFNPLSYLAASGLQSAAPAMMGEAALSSIAPAALEATAAQTATNSAIQNALAQQAAEQTARQAALGFKPFDPTQLIASGANIAPSTITPAAANTLGQQQVLNAFGQQAAGAPASTLAQTNASVQNALMQQAAEQQAAQTALGQAAAEVPVNVASGASGFPLNTPSPIVKGENALSNLMNLISDPSMQGVKEYVKEHPYATGMGAYSLYNMLQGKPEQQRPNSLIRPYEFQSQQNPAAYAPTNSTAERQYFNNRFVAKAPYAAPGPEYSKAAGGIVALGVGGPVEQMSALNAIGANADYPQAQLQTSTYTNPMVQRPMPSNIVTAGVDAPTEAYSGESRFAGGGLSDLGGYSDGGRLLKGPGDGVSDSIPAVIGERQPARLADGEFVVPARIVSELGNGSTEAGAKKLYAMMDRVQKSRSKSIGKDKVAVDSKASKHLPA